MRKIIWKYALIVSVSTTLAAASAAARPMPPSAARVGGGTVGWG